MKSISVTQQRRMQSISQRRDLELKELQEIRVKKSKAEEELRKTIKETARERTSSENLKKEAAKEDERISKRLKELEDKELASHTTLKEVEKKITIADASLGIYQEEVASTKEEILKLEADKHNLEDINNDLERQIIARGRKINESNELLSDIIGVLNDKTTDSTELEKHLSTLKLSVNELGEDIFHNQSWEQYLSSREEFLVKQFAIMGVPYTTFNGKK